MKKRIAAVLAIAATAAIGASSSASAYSDPLYVAHDTCITHDPLCPIINGIPTVSAAALLGPELSDAVCGSVPETPIVLPPVYAYVCLKLP